MEDGGDKRVHADYKVDRISNLPDSLKILLKLRTKDVVKTSLLSSSWRNLWRYVPGLDLDSHDFLEYGSFVSFVDSFLGFNNESRLQGFKLLCDLHKYESTHLTKWLDTLIDRKVEHLDLGGHRYYQKELEMPQILYTCESLVSLKFCALNLASPKFVSLPCLKNIDLVLVRFTGDLDLETLISGCPRLENLYILSLRSYNDDIEVLRVRSESLLSLTYTGKYFERPLKDLVVVIDAPRLEYMSLIAHGVASFELRNLSSLVKAHIDIQFNLCFGRKLNPNDIPKRNGISNVKDMIITSSTLKVMYDYSKCQRLPLFRKLSSLRVELNNYRWEMLPIFLERCPNLKSLVMGSSRYPKKEGRSIVSGPRCLLKSLEYVKIERPLKGEEREMKLVRYLLEISPILKKLTLRLDDSIKKEESVFLKELVTVPKISTSCQVVVL